MQTDGLNKRKHKVAITGIGMLSPLGNSAESTWQKLENGFSLSDTLSRDDIAPYFYHSMSAFSEEAAVQKNSIRRNMSRSQIYCYYSAAQALEDANLIDDHERLKDMALFVACNDGDRNQEADFLISKQAAHLSGSERDIALNQHFLKERPNFFLTNLPNLFAANIAMNLGVTGNSVTIHGEELGGINAVQQAFELVSNGEQDAVLVGGTTDGAKLHFLMYQALAGCLCRDQFVDIWQREASEHVPGSASTFLVLESLESARQRNAPIKAIMEGIDIFNGQDIDVSADIKALITPANTALFSCSYSSGAIARHEARHKSDLLKSLTSRHLSNAMGSTAEAALPLGIALAALALNKDNLFPRLIADTDASAVAGGSESDWPADASLERLIVNCISEYQVGAVCALTICP